jgi:hypothetical protein
MITANDEIRTPPPLEFLEKVLSKHAPQHSSATMKAINTIKPQYASNAARTEMEKAALALSGANMIVAGSVLIGISGQVGIASVSLTLKTYGISAVVGIPTSVTLLGGGVFLAWHGIELLRSLSDENNNE